MDDMLTTVLVREEEFIHRKAELVANDRQMGTLHRPLGRCARFVDTDGESWEILRHFEELEVKGEKGKHLLVARLLDRDPPRARIVHRHVGYRLEPASRDHWGALEHKLIADGGKVILQISDTGDADFHAKIVVSHPIPSLLVAFAYYTAYWLLEFGPNPLPAAP